MTKTPEQMAEEYASKIYRLKYYVDGRLKPRQGQEGLRWLAGKNGFLAGYQAAKDELTNLPTPAKWISVKERLPEDGEIALTVCDNGKMFLLQKVSDEMFHVPIYWKYCCGFDKELAPNESYCYDVTYWMPLPEAPKGEK